MTKHLETEDLYRDFHQRLLAFVSRSVDNRADAEDLVHEIFVKIHLSLSRGVEARHLVAWTFQIARNVVVDYHRARRAGWEAPPPMDEPEPPNLAEELLLAALEPIMEGLPEKYRSAIQLTALEGQTQREAAEALGVSLSGMKSRVQRGRRLFKEQILACCEVNLDARKRVVGLRPRTEGCCDECLPGPCVFEEPPHSKLFL